jgi:hypothetical protein
MSAHRVRPARDRQFKIKRRASRTRWRLRGEKKPAALCAPPAPPEGHYLTEGLPFALAAGVQF